MNTTLIPPPDPRLRHLMQASIEQPSASLHGRILSLIRREKRAALRPGYVERLPSGGLLLLLAVVYLLLLGGGALLLMRQPDAGYGWLRGVKHLFPLLLTVGGSTAAFFCFSQLDNWLWMRERLRGNGRHEEANRL